MSNVHATATGTTSRSNTGHVGRENPPQIRCAECERTNDCDCLSQLRLVDLMAPLVRQVLEHLATDGSFMDEEPLEQLALLVDRNDQREREAAAHWSDENSQDDRDLIDDVVGSWGYEPGFRRDVEGIAQLRKVPVERVRALVDRFLRDSRPEELAPAPAPIVAWPAWAREVEAAVEQRRAA